MQTKLKSVLQFEAFETFSVIFVEYKYGLLLWKMPLKSVCIISAEQPDEGNVWEFYLSDSHLTRLMRNRIFHSVPEGY